MCETIPDERMPANILQAHHPLYVPLGVQTCVLPGYSEQQINGGEGHKGAETKLLKFGALF